MTYSLHGVAVSRGVAIGRVHIVERNQLDISEYHLAEHEIDGEVERLHSAVARAKHHLRDVRAHIPPGTPAEAGSHLRDGARDSQCSQVPLSFTVQKRDRLLVPKDEGRHPVLERKTPRHSIKPSALSIMKTSLPGAGGAVFPPPSTKRLAAAVSGGVSTTRLPLTIRTASLPGNAGLSG